MTRTNRHTISLMMALALASLWTHSAAAQPANPDSEGAAEERPWARGVSPEKQAAALVLFQEGNLLLKNSIFPRAVEKYREALKLWDHPAIHYNMVLALLNLNEPLTLHHHLTEAMRYGEAPIDADKFERAQAFKKLIEKQLSYVEITCEVEGATVTLDGNELFKAPGRYEGFVDPGPHTFAVTRQGYPRNERKRTLAAGESYQLPLKLYTQEELTRYTRNWEVWKPWAVLGAGAAVAAGGGLLHLQARNSFTSFDAEVRDCNDGAGCFMTPELASKRTRGDTLQKAAVGTYAIGGGALVTGLVLLYINRAQPYQLSPDDLDQGTSVPPVQPAISIMPLVGGGEGGVLATFQF